MKPHTLTIFALLIWWTAISQVPTVYIIDAGRVVELKKKVDLRDGRTMALVSQLIHQADSLVGIRPMSVIDKALVPVSGNKHDYMSQAPYFWYDSTKPNGLPYFRRDGVRNPEIYKITDRTYLGQLENASSKLALAWYLSGNEKYAAKAALLLRTWFLDEATRMNPHLEYGQAIPGVNTGRGIGIIETIALTNIADAAGILTGSNSWTQNDHAALQKWYGSYLDWLITSQHGKDERRAKNNHGTWYYAQAIDFALFTGDKAKAKQLVEESLARLDSQLNSDGQQPLELERTTALGYSTMNLKGWFIVARLAEKTGIDLWNFKTSKGATLTSAVEWLLPYAIGEKSWPYQQINKYNPSEIYPLLLQLKANEKYNVYMQTLKQANKDVMTALIWE
ncbi:MAG: alginate lyase family protein [Chitinophagaceae bacterium]|nr:alginate lyase family protein [Chitinophagaceae bacterium]